MLRMVSKLSVLLLVTQLVAPIAWAGWDEVPSTDFSLPNPPDKTQTALEVATLLKFQAERTTEECELGEKQARPDFQSLFGDSGLLNPREIKTLAPLMKRVGKLGERIAEYFKARYKRTRPYNFDARIKPCVKPPGGAKSYPSSHATVSTLDACVLAAIFPPYEQDFLKLGSILSERRLRVGVHFPSDVKAGQNLGMAICDRLGDDEDFVAEIEKLRKAL